MIKPTLAITAKRVLYALAGLIASLVAIVLVATK